MHIGLFQIIHISKLNVLSKKSVIIKVNNIPVKSYLNKMIYSFGGVKNVPTFFKTFLRFYKGLLRTVRFPIQTG